MATNNEAGIRPEYVGSHDPAIIRPEVKRIFNAQAKEPNATDYGYWTGKVVESENGWDSYWAINKMWPDAPLPLTMPAATAPHPDAPVASQLDRIEAKLDTLLAALKKYL